MSLSTARLHRQPLSLKDVRVADHFWAPRRDLVRTSTIPQQEVQMRREGHIDALKLTWKPGDPKEPHIFWESDLAKWIEAASYCLATTPDPELEQAVDQVIALLASAQQADGYLNAYFTVVKPGQRFTDLRDAHELYCAGHLIEAGVAHHDATGKTTLLDIVCRYADLIDDVFSPGGTCDGGYCGHQEIELALIKLYRATGESRYRDLSRRFIDRRGQKPFYFDVEEQRRGNGGYFASAFPNRANESEHWREYNQSHLPVRDQNELVGHSVRALYMMSAMTDLAAEYDDRELTAAVVRLWDDLTEKKLYLTGGVGSDPTIEGFGPAYDLPDDHGYAETCAAIALVQWAQRMSNLTGEAHYIDTLERALYNGVLSGASADGTHYFYGNPLASNGDVHRQEWFGCACCPPNLARLISELGHYIYSQGNDEAIVNLFVDSTALFGFSSGVLEVEQRTTYPREGTVDLLITPDADLGTATLSVRIPSWSQPSIKINGEILDPPTLTNGYLRLDRQWKVGDTVNLDLGMKIRRTWAHPSVTSATGKVALERGPIIFCLEGVDHATGVHRICLPSEAVIEARADDRTGIVTLHAAAVADAEQPGQGALYRGSASERKQVDLTAVPYFSWANRGQSEMTVWIREGC